jgi:hypothetical protein
MNTNVVNRRIIYTQALASGGGGGITLTNNTNATAFSNTGGAIAPTVTMPSCLSGDIVFLAVVSNDPGARGLIVVTSPNLTWTRRIEDGAPGVHNEIWSAIAAGNLTNEVITCTNSASAFTTLGVFAFTGTRGAGIWDGSAVSALPPVNITTTTGATMVYGMMRGSVSTQGGFANGFTTIIDSNFLSVGYKYAATTGTYALDDTTTGNGTSGMVDAIKQGP